MDFVSDPLATGRKIRVLTIVDTYARFSPAVDARFSYRGEIAFKGGHAAEVDHTKMGLCIEI
jgi:hypothetical protein